MLCVENLYVELNMYETSGRGEEWLRQTLYHQNCYFKEEKVT